MWEAEICDQSPGKILGSLFHKYLYNTEPLRLRTLRDKKANNQDTGLRINQLNTRMTANYTMKHKLNMTQKLNCYLRSQLHVMKESWAPFLRGSYPYQEINQTNVDPQKCKTIMIAIRGLERSALGVRGRKHEVPES